MSIQSIASTITRTGITELYTVTANDLGDPEYGGWTLRDGGVEVAHLDPWKGGRDAIVPAVVDALDLNDDDDIVIFDVRMRDAAADDPTVSWDIEVTYR